MFVCSALLLLQLTMFGYLAHSVAIHRAEGRKVRGVAGYPAGFHVVVVARETAPLVPSQPAHPPLQARKHSNISLLVGGSKAKQLWRKLNMEKQLKH